MEQEIGSPMRRENDFGAPMYAVGLKMGGVEDCDSTGGLKNVLAERYYSMPSGIQYTLSSNTRGGNWGKKAGTVGLSREIAIPAPIRDVESMLGRYTFMDVEGVFGKRDGWDGKRDGWDD